MEDPNAEIVARLRAAGCVFAEDEATLLLAEAPDPATLEAWVGRRVDGEPLETLVGWADLDGVRVGVAPGVFVPRRRTALLVHVAQQRARAVAASGRSPVVVDLCCGSGGVGLVVASRVPGSVLHAVDLDPVAVACAAANLAAVGGVAHLGDLDAPLPEALRGRVDVLVANAPYVPTAAIAGMPPEAREHEAIVALDGGDDGLDVARRVVALAPRWLAPDGVLTVECGQGQASALVTVARTAGLTAHVARDDELDGTALVARRR